MPLIHFLIVFDRANQHVIGSPLQFTDADAATEEYARVESDYRDRRDIEIVLIGSDSMETVYRTHGNYFGDGAGVPFRELVS